MQKLKLIKQRGANDCGIACIAMVTGFQYYTALGSTYLCYPELNEGDNGLRVPLSQRMLDTILRTLGVEPIRGLNEIYGELLPDNVYIMAVVPIHGRIGHFIVVDTRFTPYEILDPAFDKRRKKFSSSHPPRTWAGLVKIKYKNE